MNKADQAFMIIIMRVHELRRLFLTESMSAEENRRQFELMLTELVTEFGATAANEAYDKCTQVLEARTCISFWYNNLGKLGYWISQVICYKRYGSEIMVQVDNMIIRDQALDDEIKSKDT